MLRSLSRKAIFVSALWNGFQGTELNGLEKGRKEEGGRGACNVLRERRAYHRPGTADILALKHVCRIFGHYNNPALPFRPVTSPPVQWSNAGLKRRYKKGWVVTVSENSTDMLYSEDIWQAGGIWFWRQQLAAIVCTVSTGTGKRFR